MGSVFSTVSESCRTFPKQDARRLFPVFTPPCSALETGWIPRAPRLNNVTQQFGRSVSWSPTTSGTFLLNIEEQPRHRASIWKPLCSVVVCMLGVSYAIYTLVLLPPLFKPGTKVGGIVAAIVFNTIFFLTCLAYVKCATTDPGKIPQHWAFYRGDVEKRQRYCKECNAWKPERTHHCSTCKRCVLNMDHHCPWINNCIGFYNRKFFIQLLAYSTAGLIWMTCHGVFEVCRIAFRLLSTTDTLDSRQRKILSFRLSVILLVMALAGFLCVALFQFTLFHIRLISLNRTTIENLDLARLPKCASETYKSKYDLGVQRNYEQVLGRARALWWLPIHTSRSTPAGDGVRWTRYVVLPGAPFLV